MHDTTWNATKPHPEHKFKHALVKLDDIPATTSADGDRWYHTEEGDYPSITTVLKKMKDHSVLDAWKERVGEKEADRQKRQAGTRGTALHKVCEKFLMNQPIDISREMPITQDLFKQISYILADNVSLVYGLEIPLYSNFLRLAGRTDGAVQWKGKNAIIDFKNSTRAKKEEWIEGYFEQTASYCVMFEERTGIAMPYMIVIISVLEEGRPQLFFKKRDDYIGNVIKMAKEYHKCQDSLNSNSG